MLQDVMEGQVKKTHVHIDNLKKELDELKTAVAESEAKLVILKKLMTKLRTELDKSKSEVKRIHELDPNMKGFATTVDL